MQLDTQISTELTSRKQLTLEFNFYRRFQLSNISVISSDATKNHISTDISLKKTTTRNLKIASLSLGEKKRVNLAGYGTANQNLQVNLQQLYFCLQ